MYPLPNLYRYQGSFIWSDFAHLVKRAALPHTAVRFAGPVNSLPDVCTVMDYNQPLRKGRTNTAHEYWLDWGRDSVVVNVAWLEGEVPLFGWAGGDIVKVNGIEVPKVRPARGVINALEILANDGIIDVEDIDVKQLLELRRR
jgi:hypothetical protein